MCGAGAHGAELRWVNRRSHLHDPENEAKKTRAEKRAGEEARATVQKLEEITDQAAQFEQLRMVRAV